MVLRYRGVDRDFRDRIKSLDPKERIVRAPETSYLSLKPGDVIQFTYVSENKNGVYQGLVVSTKRSGARGFRFAPTTLNTILQVVTLDSLSDQLLQYVINNLYKNRILSRYLAIKKRSGASDQVIDYGYLRNLGRDNENVELSRAMKESTVSRRLLGRDGRQGLVGVLNEGQFKTFDVAYINDLYSISLLNPEIAQ
tara:strand:+ start:691 stop:1278 length:588 start_codon:yes stop_codon:yes gene_type:complete